MGLFSDYLEDCRDKVCSNEIDPCLFISSNSVLKSHYFYQSVYKIQDRNSTNNTEEFGKNLRELEKIKVNSLIAEKILLKYKSVRTISSVLVVDVFNFIDEQVHQSYIGICEIINELKCHVSDYGANAIVPDSDDRIMSNILGSFMNGILYCLKNGSVVNTSECRKIVNDAADLICFFTKENLSFSKKQIFQYYLENVFNIPKSQCICCNCHSKLFFEIPYCFNCYERNL